MTPAVREPGVIHAPDGRHDVTVDGLSGNPVIAAFVASCRRAIGLDAAATDDIAHILWDKYVALVGFSGATCLTRAPIGVVFEHPESLAFLRGILSENLAVANAVGRSFPADQVDRIVTRFRSLAYATKSSMLIDLEAGKPLEAPWLQARMCALGRDHGVETPANAAVFAALAPYVGGRSPTAPPH